MYIRWTTKQLRSNHQKGPLICTHFEVERPRVTYPYLVHRYEGMLNEVVLWKPAPGIRDCCLNSKDGHALSHWWWTVGKRFEALKKVGLEDTEITQALLEQLDYIEGILEDVVPKPTIGEMRGYMYFREDLGLPDKETEVPRKNRIPSFAKVLGFDTWPCTSEELTKRWKKLALLHHPDRQGDPEKFKACKEAYTKAQDYLGL